MSNLVKHAKRELEILGMTEKSNEIDKLMYDSIMEIVKVFSKQGHSGFSSAYAINTLNKLLRYEPLAPLTGEDDEWNEVGTGTWQNKRCSHVFKDDSRAYDIQGKVFTPKNGEGSYTSSESHVTVTFPYTPTTEYVEVNE